MLTRRWMTRGQVGVWAAVASVWALGFGVVSDACGQVFVQPRVGFDASYVDRWWSWLHGWEFNRHRYVPEPAVRVGDDERVDEATRAAAVAALQSATEHNEPAVRVAAAVALGRMRADVAVDRLDALTRDDEPAARRAAWVALGLMGTPAAVARFEDADRPAELDAAGASGYLAGLACLDALPRGAADTLLKTLDETRSPALAQLAVVALRRHQPAGSQAAYRRLIFHSTEPRVVAEALIGLGELADDEAFGLIGDVYLGQGNWDDTALFRRFNTRRLEPWYVWRPIKAVQAAAAIALQYAAEEEEDAGDLDAARLALLAPFGPFDDPALRGDDRQPKNLVAARPSFREGVWRVPVPSLFSSSALNVWYGSYWGDGAIELRLGLVALGHVAFADEADRLVEVVRGGELWRRYSHERYTDEVRRFAPRRGFAVLGLGAYLNRVRTLGPLPEFAYDDELERDRGYRRVVRTLGRLVEVDGGGAFEVRGADAEPLKVRAAALVALGMSRDPDVIETLIGLTPHVNRSPVLAGYHLSALARADGRSRDVARRVIAQASRYLDEPLPPPAAGNSPSDQGKNNDRETGNSNAGNGPTRTAGSQTASPLPTALGDDTASHSLDELVALRETALALGMLGRPEAAGALRAIMARHPALAHDAAWGLRRSGDFDAIDALIDDLASDDPERVALAAAVMGVLLEPGTGDRLRWALLDHPAFVFPLTDRRAPRRIADDPVYAVRALASPFLHEHILPRRWGSP